MGRGSLLAMCAHIASVGSHVHGQSSFIGGELSLSRGGALSVVGWALFIPFVGAGSLLVGVWVLFVSGGALPHVAHIVRCGGLMFVGSSCGLRVLSGVCGCWVIVHGPCVVVCGRQGVVCGWYVSFACGIGPLWVGTDVQGHRCSVVICWHVDAVVCVVSCVVWSSLVRMDSTKINDTYLETTTKNNKIIVVHHLVATSLSVMWQLEAPILGVGNGCEW